MGKRGPQPGDSANRPPTEKQLSTLRFIATYYRERGVPPSLRDVMECAGLGSSNAANDRVRALLFRGLVERRLPKCCPRNLFITEKGHDLLRYEQGEKLLADIEKRIAE